MASLYQHVPFRQDTAFLSIGERTNANGSKAFREAMLEGRFEDCVQIARSQTRDGAHLLDVCVDYVGRDGAADMREIVGRFATAATLPLVLDSTEPAVIEAGLEMTGGRAVINSVNYEDGDGPDSRIARMMPLAREHGAAVIALTIDERGQARTAEWKVAVAERLIADLTGNWGMRVEDIIVDCLTFPIATGQEETRRDAIETIEAIAELKRRHPAVQTTLGVSNVSFGLKPAARAVLNSVFLAECTRAGLDSAIVHAARIMPIARLSDEQRQVALDLVYDRRREGYDPLARLLELFEGVDAADLKANRAAELAGLPLWERLKRRIIDGERALGDGLEADLDAALAQRPALEIVNDVLLDGMKTVGELFGSGQMQLPFVLTSAEVMKASVAYLEPHMERSGEEGKGKIVLATVKGDVHDIGKNLVDIILSNNGYDVVNIGIKQPISAIVTAAEENDADVIGMSGLLVKSTVVMRDNLSELNSRGLAGRWPVLLGGAALTRAYVEQDLAAQFDGQVRYARDAFEGLRLMDAAMAVKRGVPGARLPELRTRKVRTSATARGPERGTEAENPARSDINTDGPVPDVPFLGTEVIKGIPLAEYAAYLDERALFMGQWGLKPTRGGPDGKGGVTYEELVETEGRPRLRMWLERMQTEGLLEAAVVYGYFRCVSSGNDLIVLGPDGETELERFSFPRQRRDRRLCLADFFKPQGSGQTDVVAFQLATMGTRVSRATAELFAKNAYREYLELHGLSVQLAEALAEYWHARVRRELGFAGADPEDLDGFFRVGYRGARYSIGYPACPDLADRAKMVRLLEPSRIGVELSEEMQLHPEQSTDAIVVHHPEAKYFSAYDRAGTRPRRRGAVRHGRAADRLRAALAGGRDGRHGQARGRLDHRGPGSAARRQPGPHGALPAGQGEAARAARAGRRVAHVRHRRAGPRPRRAGPAGRARTAGRGGGGRPAARAGDLLRAPVHGRGAGPHRDAVRRAGVRGRRQRDQARPGAVPARGQAARRRPGPLLRPGGLAERRGLRRGRRVPGHRGPVAGPDRAGAGPDGGALADGAPGHSRGVTARMSPREARPSRILGVSPRARSANHDLDFRAEPRGGARVHL